MQDDKAGEGVLGALRRFLRWGDGAQARATQAPGAAQSDATSAARDDPRYLDLYQNALDCLARGEEDAATHMLEEALLLRHDFAEAHVKLGQIHHARGRFDDASDCYVLAIHFQRNLAIAHLQRGLLALDRAQFGDAPDHLERAIALKPDDATAWNALGAALLKLGRIDDAEASLRRALELQPGLAQAHSNLGYLLFREREQFVSGARHIETALTLAPNDEAVLCNWTMVLQQQGRFDEMLALSERLLAANPALHEVRLNRALVRLTRGEFERGWKDYEARRLLPPFAQGTRPWPEWNGESLAGRSLLVYAEQGLGDEIMFASCLPDVIGEAGSCVVECSPRLQALFQRSFPTARIIGTRGRGIAAGDYPEVPGINVGISAGSLPSRRRNALSDFPRHRGYLVADTARVAHWRDRLSGLGSGLKVGISWRGGVQTTRRSLRSVPLTNWLPILRCRDAQFVSLQYSEVARELAEVRDRYGVPVAHWQDAIDDLDETAALVTALDLVITVQTAVAHLAGAVGREAWVMISAVPEWRYGEAGESMAWYPSLRLYRQPPSGEWHGVLGAMADRLRERSARTPGHAPGEPAA